jgi:hypothetical protein
MGSFRGGCSVANNDLDEHRRRWEVQRNWDALKLFFECFKYFTTLTTAIAVALLVLALYRDLDLSSTVAESGVGALAGALLLSLIGMVYLIVRALAPMSVEFSSTGIAMLMLLIAILFFAGLVAVVGDATDLFVI